MTVRVLLFGAESTALGRSHVDVALDGDRSCRALLKRLGESYPALLPHLSIARIAVNSEFAPPERTIGAHDEIALIGLVSGG